MRLLVITRQKDIRLIPESSFLDQQPVPMMVVHEEAIQSL